jgi:hypothetical protein
LCVPSYPSNKMVQVKWCVHAAARCHIELACFLSDSQSRTSFASEFGRIRQASAAAIRHSQGVLQFKNETIETYLFFVMKYLERNDSNRLRIHKVYRNKQ